MGANLNPFRENGLGMMTPAATELHQVVADLYVDASRYASDVQLQAPNGDFLTIRRHLHTSHAEFPAPRSPLLDESDGRSPEPDPYVYTMARQRPDLAPYSALSVQSLGNLSIVTGTSIVPTDQGEKSFGFDQDGTVAEIDTVLKLIREGQTNESAEALLMMWSEVKGKEAERFHRMIELALRSVGVDMHTLGEGVAIAPIETVEGPWELDALFVAPASEQARDNRIPGLQLGAYACLEDDTVVGGLAVYDDRIRDRLDTLVVKYARVPNQNVFLSAGQRDEAHMALVQQLRPGNVYRMKITDEDTEV